MPPRQKAETPLQPLELSIELPEKLYCKQKATAILRIRGGRGPYTLSGKGRSIQIGSADATETEAKIPIQAPAEPGTFTFEAEARDAADSDPVASTATCPV